MGAASVYDGSARTANLSKKINVPGINHYCSRRFGPWVTASRKDAAKPVVYLFNHDRYITVSVSSVSTDNLSPTETENAPIPGMLSTFRQELKPHGMLWAQMTLGVMLMATVFAYYTVWHANEKRRRTSSIYAWHRLPMPSKNEWSPITRCFTVAWDS